LNELVAIVTGSTSGIGEATARSLHAEGYRLVVNSARSIEAGHALAEELDAEYVRADVAKESEAQALVSRALEKWGRADVVVNCAGRTVQVPFEDLESINSQLFEGILSTNLIGAWNVTRAAAPTLRKHGGVIVNVTSLAGVRPLGSSIPYAVSKAGLNHMTLLLARGLAPTVRVNAIAAGLIETPFIAERQEARMDWLERSPLRRIGSPEEIAQACLFLIAAEYITGEILIVDGGMHLV
jgi:ketoreductase RED2